MRLKKRIRKQHIPSVFTLVNLFLGFLAIISIVEGYPLRATSLIIAAGIFDVLDGKLARLIHSPTQFGKELDSLADVVSFCVAPAVLVWALYARDLYPVLGALIAGAPLYFGVLRLARYNTNAALQPRRYFEGLPSPMSALAVVALVIYYSDSARSAGANVVLPAIVAVSFLMISQIHFPKFPQLSFRAGWGNTVFLLGIAGLAIAGLIWGSWVLLPGVVVYIASALVRWVVRSETIPPVRSIEKEA